MKKGSGGCWLVVYMTHSKGRAQQAEQLLLREGFLVRSSALDRAVSQAGAFELRVLESEAQEAQKIIIESGL